MTGVNFTPKTAAKLLKMSREVPDASLRSQSFEQARQPIYFRNDATESVPAFGCVKVTGAVEESGRALVVVGQPDGTGGPFLINNWREVPQDGYGVGYTGVVKAAYSTGTPAAGETWGVDSGSWLLTSGGTDDVVLVFGSIKDEVGDKVLLGSTVIPTDATAIALYCTQVGGSQGTVSAANTYTYDVTDAISGATLLSAVDPTSGSHKHQRVFGTVTTAKSGVGVMVSGALVILSINEIANVEVCV